MSRLGVSSESPKDRAPDGAASGKAESEARLWLDDTRVWADALLEAALDAHDLGPDVLSAPVRYAMLGGGKRIRPALCRLVGEALGAEPETIEAGSIAVECIHTYSLVHDDLPSMDDDDVRRGRATVHVAYDEATAVLVGDALQALAFEELAAGDFGARTAEAVRCLARAAGGIGMVGGQALDLAAEGEVNPSVDSVRAIHGLKTAALFGAAAELGAIAAPEGPKSAQFASDARAFGRALGLTFQALDDVLDVTGDVVSLGKTPGKDDDAAKATLVRALGLEGARAEAKGHAQSALDAADRLGLGLLGSGLVELLLGRSS